MKARQRIGIAQTQRLQLNTGLATSIRILGLDASDLSRYLEEQAALNPAIVVEHSEPAPGEWLPRWTDAFRTTGGGTAQDIGVAPLPSLMAHVMDEIMRLTAPGRPRTLAIALAEALEPSGWIGQPLATIAHSVNAEEAEVESVLLLLQQIEPVGLFARSLSECLCLQAEDAGLLDPVMKHMLDHLDLVASGDLGRIAKACKVPEDRIRDRLRLMRRFDPKPGTQFVHGAAPTREPDLIAIKGDAGWEVSLNRSALPSLRINADGVVDDEGRSCLQQAKLLGRMVESRNATMLKVGRAILMRQLAALDHGQAALVPMTMAEIATTVSLHESTVSRVVAGSSVDTPHGTIWLRRLFTGRLGDAHSPASAEVRAVLMQLIANEDPASPLTDAQLADALAAHQLPVARRTLAKYRGMLNIPAASRRRRR